MVDAARRPRIEPVPGLATVPSPETLANHMPMRARGQRSVRDRLRVSGERFDVVRRAGRLAAAMDRRGHDALRRALLRRTRRHGASTLAVALDAGHHAAATSSSSTRRSACTLPCRDATVACRSASCGHRLPNVSNASCRLRRRAAPMASHRGRWGLIRAGQTGRRQSWGARDRGGNARESSATTPPRATNRSLSHRDVAAR